MILLPAIRQSYLRSFSIPLGLWVAAPLASVALVSRSEIWLVLTLLLASGITVAGFFWPLIMSTPYKLWNLLANYFGRGARIIILGICFYIVLLSVGRAGSSLPVSRFGLNESLWKAKNTLPPTDYFYEYSGSLKSSPASTWIQSYYCWANASGQLWALCLLPFVIVLSMVEIDEDRRFPAGIYTLF